MPAAPHLTSIQGFPDVLVDVLVDALVDDLMAQRGGVCAIAGLQGSGKSTLAAQVQSRAHARGLRLAVLSIDDFYFGHRQRQRLARRVHPLLVNRGPPGTHDVALACEVIDALRDGRDTRLPRFDKLADTRLPPSRWPKAAGVDGVVLEGWLLKVPPQDPAALSVAVNALERDEDADGSWRHYCNEALGRDYPPLWSRLPQMLFLQPPGFDVVPHWRWQQERRLQADNPRRVAMTQAQVERFVQLFERVSRQALRTLPTIATRTLRIDAARRPLA